MWRRGSAQASGATAPIPAWFSRELTVGDLWATSDGQPLHGGDPRLSAFGGIPGFIELTLWPVVCD